MLGWGSPIAGLCPRPPVRLFPQPQRLRDTPVGSPDAGVTILADTLTNARLLVEIAFGADPSGDVSLWSWVDVTSDVCVADRQKIKISRGKRDEYSQTSPASCSLRLKNPSADYSSHNPSSSNYPNVRIGTPLRVQINLGTGWQLLYQGNIYGGWKPIWDSTGTKSLIAVTAHGTLRRIQTGDPIGSPLFRTISTDGPVAYWSCEDGSSATSVAELSGGTPITWSTASPTLGSGGPDGSSGALTMATGTELVAATPSTGTSYWSVQLVVKIPATPTGSSQILRWTTTGGTHRYFALTVFPAGSPETVGIESFDTSGSRTEDFETDFVIGTLTEPYGRDLVFTVCARQSGSNVEYEFGMFDVLTGQSGGRAGGSYAGNLNPITGISVPGFYDHSTGGGWEYSHISVWNKSLDATWGSLTMAHVGAADGYTGEDSLVRLARLCAEEGIPLATLGADSSATVAMGPQTSDTLINLLRKSESAMGATLYDGFGPGLAIQPVSSRYNQATALTLDAAAGDVQDPFDPADDDQLIHNRAKVSRSGGSFAVAEDEDGPLGTGLIGIFAASPLTLYSYDDTRLADRAWWEVNKGTVDELRYPAVEMFLEHRPALASGWLACTPGSRIDIDNVSTVRTQHPPGTVRLVMEGDSQEIDQFTWHVTAVCVPARPYDVFTFDDDLLGRLEAAESTLHQQYSASDTSLLVDVASGDALWSTDSADVPVDVDIGGEQVTVTNISGSSSPQTFTVTRAVNGVSKIQPIGTQVRLWQPGVIGL